MGARYSYEKIPDVVTTSKSAPIDRPSPEFPPEARLTHGDYYGIIEAMRELLDNDDWSEKVSKVWGDRRFTIAHVITYAGSLAMLKRALTFGAKMDTKDAFNRSPLQYAAFQGQAEIVNWLINEHWAGSESHIGLTQIAQRNCVGNTALHEAIEGLQEHESRNSEQFILGNLQAIRYLVKAGADVNASGGTIDRMRLTKRCSPLYLTGHVLTYCSPDGVGDTGRYYEEAIDILLSNGAKVNLHKERTDGRMVLHHAAYLGSDKAIKQLVKAYKLDNDQQNWDSTRREFVDSPDTDDDTPLKLAIFHESPECARALIECGADLSRMDKDEKTPLSTILRQYRGQTFLTEILDSRVYFREQYSRTAHNKAVVTDFSPLMTGKCEISVVSALCDDATDEKDMVLEHPLIETLIVSKYAQYRLRFRLLAIIMTILVVAFTSLVYRNLFYVKRPEMVHWSMFAWTVIMLVYSIYLVSVFQWCFFKQLEFYLSMLSAMICAVGLTFPPATITFVAVSVLLAWFELALAYCRIFRIWEHQYHMYRIALCDISKSLVIFIFVIAAFALSFGILFNGNPGFTNPLVALIKTMTMMSGEFDVGVFDNAPGNATLYNDNPEDKISIIILFYVPLMVFLLFLIFVPITLVNLLIGLVVSDVQLLRKQGKILRLMGLVEVMDHLEGNQNLGPKQVRDFFSRSCPRLKNWRAPGRAWDSVTECVRGLLDCCSPCFNWLCGKPAQLENVRELDLSDPRDLPAGVSQELRDRLLDLATKNKQKSRTQASNPGVAPLTLSEEQERINAWEKRFPEFRITMTD